MLTQINPRAFRFVLCSRIAFLLRQTVVKCFLSEERRRCANQPKKRNDANEHLAAKSTLVRSKLQAMCRLKYGRKNAVNHQPYDKRNHNDNHRRDLLRNNGDVAVQLALINIGNRLHRFSEASRLFAHRHHVGKQIRKNVL